MDKNSCENCYYCTLIFGNTLGLTVTVTCQEDPYATKVVKSDGWCDRWEDNGLWLGEYDDAS